MTKRPRPESPIPSSNGKSSVVAPPADGHQAEGDSSKKARAEPPEPTSRYSYAVVCSSNINRSMEAHVAFFNNHLKVKSYGAGRLVRLPAPTSEGNNFEFGTPYEKMLQVMTADTKHAEFYRKTRLVDILRRNMQIKLAPARWQDTGYDIVGEHDVVICFEQRIFDAVTEDLQSREARDLKPIIVICMETKDEPKEAVLGGRSAVKLAQKLEKVDDLASDAPAVVEEFQEAEGKRLLFQVCYL